MDCVYESNRFAIAKLKNNTIGIGSVAPVYL